MRKEKAETLITEHDRRIPRRQAVVRHGRRGVTMSIDPYNDVEIYEVDIEDTLRTLEYVWIKNLKKNFY